MGGARHLPLSRPVSDGFQFRSYFNTKFFIFALRALSLVQGLEVDWVVRADLESVDKCGLINLPSLDSYSVK